MWFSMFIFVYISVILVIALFTVLRCSRDVNVYAHLFYWYFFPVIAISGILFIDKNKRKIYYKRMRANLFLNDGNKE